MTDLDPELVEKVAQAIDSADDRWQHGIAGSREVWERYVARAVLSVVAPDIYQQALTDALHPEFGTEWRAPDGVVWKATQQVKHQVWDEGFNAGLNEDVRVENGYEPSTNPYLGESDG